MPETGRRARCAVSRLIPRDLLKPETSAFA
jgi:hypothetical protein